MGCIPYQTVADASRSLQSTYIMFDGRPVWVTDVDGPGGILNPDQITIRFIPTPIVRGTARQHCTLNDPRLDISNLRLGYLNAPEDCVYCSRAPNRSTVQGLNNANVSINNITNNGDEMRYSLVDVAALPTFVDMFTNTYPTVREVLTEFKTSRVRSRAFGRLFALSRDDFRGDYVVHYRNDKVGYGDLETGRVNLAKQYSYLREQLVEMGLNVA